MGRRVVAFIIDYLLLGPRSRSVLPAGDPHHPDGPPHRDAYERQVRQGHVLPPGRRRHQLLRHRGADRSALRRRDPGAHRGHDREADLWDPGHAGGRKPARYRPRAGAVGAPDRGRLPVLHPDAHGLHRRHEQRPAPARRGHGGRHVRRPRRHRRPAAAAEPSAAALRSRRHLPPGPRRIRPRRPPQRRRRRLPSQSAPGASGRASARGRSRPAPAAPEPAAAAPPPAPTAPTRPERAPAAPVAPPAAPAHAAAPPAAEAAIPAPPAPPPPPMPPANWYPDPSGNARLRYWDGGRWTDHTAHERARSAGTIAARVCGPQSSA